MAEGDSALIEELVTLWQTERRNLDRIDAWARWDHEAPHQPKHATNEYKELAARSQAPWGDLIVGSVAQTLFVEGYRTPTGEGDLAAWLIWQANGFDARQIAIHRAALTYGLAYATCIPGRGLTGASMPKMRGVSPREMIAVYDDVADDEWPVYALKVAKRRSGWKLTLMDDQEFREYTVEHLGDKLPEPVVQTHGVGVTPVVRYANRFDLEGRSAGEVEPFINVLGRIDQTTFDRLVVQRFASWIVRTIAGMSVAESVGSTVGADSTLTDAEKAQTVKMRLAVEDMLIAEDPDTKFGHLPASPLDGFIEAHDADLRVLAAVSQSPAHELLGTMANLSAEALAAARASQTAKSDERKHEFGESHEQLLRLASFVAGDPDGAQEFAAEVRWKDTEIRSMAQAADALGKMAQMLHVPVELLWEKIPGWTAQDVERAKAMVKESGIEALMRTLAGATEPVDTSAVAETEGA